MIQNRGQNNINRSLEWLGGVHNFSGGSNCRYAENRKLELEVEWGVTELLQYHDATLVAEKLLLVDDQRKWFLGIESSTGEELVKLK